MTVAPPSNRGLGDDSENWNKIHDFVMKYEKYECDGVSMSRKQVMNEVYFYNFKHRKCFKLFYFSSFLFFQMDT